MASARTTARDRRGHRRRGCQRTATAATMCERVDERRLVNKRARRRFESQRARDDRRAAATTTRNDERRFSAAARARDMKTTTTPVFINTIRQSPIVGDQPASDRPTRRRRRSAANESCRGARASTGADEFRRLDDRLLHSVFESVDCLVSSALNDDLLAADDLDRVVCNVKSATCIAIASSSCLCRSKIIASTSGCSLAIWLV